MARLFPRRAQSRLLDSLGREQEENFRLMLARIRDHAMQIGPEA